MKKALNGLLGLVLVASLAGCGGSDSEGGDVEEVSRADRAIEREDEAMPAAEGSATVEAPAAEEPEMTEAAPAEEAPAAETTAEAAPATGAPAEAAPAAEGDTLTGTKWVHNEITLEFLPNSEVKLSGGTLATLAPSGHTAQYTLADEALSVEVFGQVYAGTWDGTTLIVDGTEAKKVE